MVTWKRGWNYLVLKINSALLLQWIFLKMFKLLFLFQSIINNTKYNHNGSFIALRSFLKRGLASSCRKNKMQFSNTAWWEVPLQNGLKMSLWAFGSSLVTFRPISGWKKKLGKTRENRENFAISATLKRHLATKTY